MTKYRAMVQYRFKKGMEEQGLKFLENELIKKGDSYGCHNIELLQYEEDHSLVIGIALWNDLSDARNFQAKWATKEHELLKYLVSSPKREFFKIRSTFNEKMRKAA